MLEGIDVSVFQGQIDWQKVASEGVSFAICRATVGLGIDPSFLTNIRGARAAGLLVGAYHAFETSHDSEAQAKRFASVAADILDIAPFLDFEGGCAGIDPRSCVNMAQRFCESTDTMFLKTCGVYTYPFFWKGLTSRILDATEWCVSRPFWLALYPGKDNPNPIEPFSSVDLHQYSGTSRDVPGVHTTCDRDRFYGTIDEIRNVGVFLVE